MRLVMLNGLEKDEQTNFIEDLILIFENNNIEIKHFKLKDMNILPCTSCGSCGLITPGKCVLKDDMEEIFKAISHSDGMVFVTPIRFGGYSSTLKKAVDRFSVLGLPLYIYKDGYLLHPMRYELKWIIGVGINEKRNNNQIESFKKLVAHNSLNMHAKHKVFITDLEHITEDSKLNIDSMIKGVSVV